MIYFNFRAYFVKETKSKREGNCDLMSKDLLALLFNEWL